MTHDELLKELDDVAEFADYDPYPRAVKALRAVVEIHKPMLWKNLGNDTQGYFCRHCDSLSNEDAYRIVYPCPTIQAIEKELG